jgi:hypothetical protein
MSGWGVLLLLWLREVWVVMGIWLCILGRGGIITLGREGVGVMVLETWIWR